MDLILRKRIALNIYKRQSITDRIKKKIVRSDVLTQTGVTYEVVSNIPKASEELEDRESLAQMAALGEDSIIDGETYIGKIHQRKVYYVSNCCCFIEKYMRGVSAVESILTLDRLRQSVAVKELLQAQGPPLMRKTVSVPNFQVRILCSILPFILFKCHLYTVYILLMQSQYQASETKSGVRLNIVLCYGHIEVYLLFQELMDALYVLIPLIFFCI